MSYLAIWHLLSHSVHMDQDVIVLQFKIGVLHVSYKYDLWWLCLRYCLWRHIIAFVYYIKSSLLFMALHYHFHGKLQKWGDGISCFLTASANKFAINRAANVANEFYIFTDASINTAIPIPVYLLLLLFMILHHSFWLWHYIITFMENFKNWHTK